MSVRIAACAYPIEVQADFAAYAAKQSAYVSEAVARGAQLLVFPEYASVELTSVLPGGLLPPPAPLEPAALRAELRRQLEALQPMAAEVVELFGELARKAGVYILGPSFPERAEDGRYYNRARLHAPSGARGLVEKLQMTRFEREDWGVSGAKSSPVFETELGVIGAAICYDSEFPLIVHRQVALGAGIVLVPSCTDTLSGYHRVELSCRARALENQCYVAQAPTVGSAPWSLALDHNHGRAAVFGPVDYGYASDGVIAAGVLDRPGWVFADLDLELETRVRELGQVTNYADWDLPGHLTAAIERVRV